MNLADLTFEEMDRAIENLVILGELPEPNMFIGEYIRLKAANIDKLSEDIQIASEYLF